ncbi:hypothetical protein [Bradyrhizobium nitroreducens]|nr:hypothetical protein [Bradyrhizobium nitroreducens]
MTVTFKASLQGNPWDLWGLSKIFDGTNSDATCIHAKDPAIVRLDMRKPEDREHFNMFGHEAHVDLTSNRFTLEYPFNGRSMYELAMPVINRINAIGRLLDPEFTPVTLFSCDYPRDKPNSFNLYGPGKPYKNKTGLGEQGQSPFAHDVFELGSENSVIDFVMETWTLPTTWASLYLIYEAIRDNVGGQAELEQFNFVTGQELRDFRFAANTCRVISEGIRHASRLDEATLSHIPLSDACQIINKLTVGWLDAWRAEVSARRMG